MIVDGKQLLEKSLDFVSQNHVLESEFVAHERNDDHRFGVPQLVLNLLHLREECRVEVEQLPTKCRVLGLNELDAAPLEDNVD